MSIGDISFYGLTPIILFTFTICALTLVVSLTRSQHQFHLQCGVASSVISGIGVLLWGIVRWRQFDIGELDQADFTTLNGLVSTDRLAVISTMVIALLVIITAIIAYYYFGTRDDMPAGEFFILLQTSALGMCAMVMANDLIAMFVALEVFSIPLYVLTAFDRRRMRSLEGGFKYFIMGAVSSAILLYGIALHYGLSGSTAFAPLYSSAVLGIVSSIFISVGLFFKVAGVPFHFWAPDAYQGAPSPVSTFMSAATKLTAFIVFVRLISSGVLDLSGDDSRLRIIFTIVCIASAIVGSFLALRQSNIKRAFAYSSITHSAYIILALKAGTQMSLTAAVTYVVIYSLIIAGTFAIISILATTTEQNDLLSAIKGLGKTNPYLGGSLAVLLFAQAGIPLTSGFIAKFDVFRAAFASHFYISGIIILITTVVGAAFYLRLVLMIYSDSFEEKFTDVVSNVSVPTGARIVIGICVASVILWGIFPGLITGFTHVL